MYMFVGVFVGVCGCVCATEGPLPSLPQSVNQSIFALELEGDNSAGEIHAIDMQSNDVKTAALSSQPHVSAHCS